MVFFELTFHPGDHFCNLAVLKFQEHIYVHVPYVYAAVLNNILLACFCNLLDGYL